MTGPSHTEITECYSCKSKVDIPGNAHIMCINPDPLMTGVAHGIKMGWFLYPTLFDPVWKTKKCNNYEPIKIKVQNNRSKKPINK